MYRNINLSINNFPSVPSSLVSPTSSGSAVDEVSIDLARLYHHYYLDTRGVEPPNPDPAQFQHLSFLTSTSDFRVRGSGFGTHSAYRQHVSNELGQAFCRWFLYEFLGITYFAHMEHVLDLGKQNRFGDFQVERIDSGDAPDYLCTVDASQVYLAEAKGRMSAINFTSREFTRWRKQFSRVLVRDGGGVARSVKGYIVATRFAKEINPQVKSRVFVEDPETEGEGRIGRDQFPGVGVIRLHYAEIARKLGQLLLSAILESGGVADVELLFPAYVWQPRFGPYEKTRFVGGYFPGPFGLPPIALKNGQIQFRNENPFRLDLSTGTFFGVEEGIFKRLCEVARSRDFLPQILEPIPEPEFFYSGISFLRDGSIIGPVDFFQPVAQVDF